MNPAEFELAAMDMRRRLVRVAARVVGHADAEDVVQITLSTEYANCARIVDAAAYLLTAVTRDAQNYAQSENRQFAHVGEYLDRHGSPAVVEDVDAIDARIDVRRVLSALPDDVARALHAVYAEGATWDAAAAELGVLRQTLQKRVAKWLPYVQEQLGWRDPGSSRTTY